MDGYDTSGVIDPDFNWVEASCEGNTLRLWIYSELIAEVTDPDSSFGSGDVGFVVGAFNDPACGGQHRRFCGHILELDSTYTSRFYDHQKPGPILDPAFLIH